MSLQQLSKEELRETALIELAHQFMEDTKQAISFTDLVEELGKLLDLSKEEIRSRVVQFYTDLNIDGRFLSLGENRWGLRTWYPYDQIDEEVAPAVKSKKKKSKKVVEEDEDDIVDDDDDLDYDDLDDFEDEDDLIDDDNDDDDAEDESFDDIDDDDEDDDEVFEEEELIGEDEYDLDDEDDEEEELEEDDEEEEKE